MISLAEQLRKAISSYPFSLGEQKTASFGGSTCKHNQNIDAMVKQADDHLCWAKKNGRNRVGYDGADTDL